MWSAPKFQTKDKTMNSFSIFSFLGTATDNSMSINNGWTIVAAVLSTMIGMLGIFYVYLR